MEVELVKKLNINNVKARVVSVPFSDEEEFAFARQSIELVKSFAQTGLNGQGIVEFFVLNVEKLFKLRQGPALEASVSKYVSAMAHYQKSAEIAMFREFLMQNINVNSARMLKLAFQEVLNIHKEAYSTKHKMLKQLKIDLKQALSVTSEILKKPSAVAYFVEEVSNYAIERQQNVAKITCDLFFTLLLKSQLSAEEFPVVNKREAEKLKIEWDQFDPQTFEIKVPKEAPPTTIVLTKAQTNSKLETSKNERKLNGTIEAINDLAKTGVSKTQPISNKQEAAQNKMHATDSFGRLPNARPIVAAQTPVDDSLGQAKKLNRVCHPYVFGKDQPVATSAEQSAEDVDKQIIFLKTKLEKQNEELKQKRDFFKKTIEGCRPVIQSYQKMRIEIGAAEGLADAFLGSVEKNSEAWRELYKVKNVEIDELQRQKFFVAAILESASQAVSSDFEKFKFSNNEDVFKMNQMFQKKPQFDIYEYLNTIQLPEKFKFSVNNPEQMPEKNTLDDKPEVFAMFAPRKTEKEPKVQKVEEFSFPVNESKVRQGLEEIEYNETVKAKAKKTVAAVPEPAVKEMKLNGRVYSPEERKNYEADMKKRLEDLRLDLIYRKEGGSKDKKIGGKTPEKKALRSGKEGSKEIVEQNRQKTKSEVRVTADLETLQEDERRKTSGFDFSLNNQAAGQQTQSEKELAAADDEILISRQTEGKPITPLKTKGYKVMKF